MTRTMIAGVLAVSVFLMITPRAAKADTEPIDLVPVAVEVPEALPDPRDWENMLAMRVIIPLIPITVKEPASCTDEIRQEGSDKTITINIAQDSEGGKPCGI